MLYTLIYTYLQPHSYMCAHTYVYAYLCIYMMLHKINIHRAVHLPIYLIYPEEFPVPTRGMNDPLAVSPTTIYH